MNRDKKKKKNLVLEYHKVRMEEEKQKQNTKTSSILWTLNIFNKNLSYKRKREFQIQNTNPPPY